MFTSKYSKIVSKRLDLPLTSVVRKTSLLRQRSLIVPPLPTREGRPRLYYVDDPHITRPLVRHDEPAVGFYVLNC